MGFKVETGFGYTTDFSSVGKIAQQAEAMGYDTIHSSETRNDPFLPLVLVAEYTEKIKLSTAVAIAFPRSPFVTAMMAWDLQRYSNGRFVLGLGTQVKPHIERRFSMEWTAPAPRIREYIQTLRAIWDTFQNNTKPGYRGEHYQFTLINPVFNPGPIEHPYIPVQLAAVNPVNASVAGEVADGINLHPFNTMSYAKAQLLPAVQKGLDKSGRNRENFVVWGGGFLATGKNEEEIQKALFQVKNSIGFYGSTPTYKPVLEHHGWNDLAEELHKLSISNGWAKMPEIIPDEVVNEFCVIATYDDVAAKLRERYEGVVDCIDFAGYTQMISDQDVVQQIINDLKK
jgi:probable F420-dependent oxidoreductase